jgi:hypothetical protein
MKIGDEVQLTGLPEKLPDETFMVFSKCLGHPLVIVDFNEIGWAEINVESVTESIGETIWVEPEYLEAISK